MKTTSSRLSQWIWLATVACCISYMAYLTARIRALEHSPYTRNPNLQASLQEFERAIAAIKSSPPPTIQFPAHSENFKALTNFNNPNLEQRLDKIEKQMQPHIELLSGTAINK